LTNAAPVKTLTARRAAILLKHHAPGFGGASAVSVAVFASPSVGAGSSHTGAALLTPPPGASGAPGFFEQLQQATAHAGGSDSAAETPAPTPIVINAPSQNVPPAALASVAFGMAKLAMPLGNADGDIEQLQRTRARAGDSDSATETPAPTPIVINVPSKNVPPAAPASVAVGMAKLATPLGTADSADKFSSSGSDIPVFSAQSVQPAITIGKDLKTSGLVPVVTRGSDRRAVPHDAGSEVVADPRPPASGLHSDQNNDLRNLIPAQVPATGSAPEPASQPSSTLLQMETSVTATAPIRTDPAVNPNIGEFAFAARIKPGVASAQQPSFSATVASSMAHGEPASQTVKATGEASTRNGDPGYDEQKNSATPAAGSVSSAAKPSFRKDGAADIAANAVEQNPAPLPQPIPQPISASVVVEPASAAKPTPAAQSVAAPEPTHGLADRTTQATAPVRNISLQVEAASGQTVDIRMAARAGDLNVAVRSGDPVMAQDLRQGLGDLESRLAQSGYHAETWHPGHNGPTTESAAHSGNSSNSPSQQQSQSGSGWSQQNRGQRDNNPSNRPRWVNQLASTLKAESTEKGNANGIIT